MKSVKSIVLVALVALVAVACGKVEKILPKKDGMWVGVSSHVVSYQDDSLTSDITQTDSLGSMYFDKEGTGYSLNFGSATQYPFTWSVNDDNDKLTITSTDSGAVASVMDILESSNKEMTLFSSTTFTVSSINFKVEATSVIERAE